MNSGSQTKQHISPQGSGSPRRLQSNRSDLILVFGALSLFLCGPLGIIAWIMANSDLRKIRQGVMSSEKIGTLKVGRVLAIVGTVLFAITLALGAVALSRGFRFFHDGIGGLAGPKPLGPHQMVFVGEWYGSEGTFIRIHPDGRADFQGEHTSMTGGLVEIEDDVLSIGFLGFVKTWRIEKRPKLEDAQWKMELDGEVFTRRSEGLYVRQGGIGRNRLDPQIAWQSSRSPSANQAMGGSPGGSL